MSFKGSCHLRLLVAWAVLFCFTLSTTLGYAQTTFDPGLKLADPHSMVGLSPAFTPALLKGIRIHPQDPLRFDFIVNKGDETLSPDQKKELYTRLIKYFLASLAIPDEAQWVNLSPYEEDRIIREEFGRTEMGRDLLAQDYLLKQITSSLMFPESGTGKAFWERVYREAFEKYGTTDIPVDTFNKVWITPDAAVIYEKGDAAYLGASHLKVQLESDYIAAHRNGAVEVADRSTASFEVKQVMREVIIPSLEKEVNEGTNFAPLRQIFSSMILAAWYKTALKQTFVGRVYADKSKVRGVQQQDVTENQRIYAQYVEAFKAGVYDLIREEQDPLTQDLVTRKYFSGGIRHPEAAALTTRHVDDFSGIVSGTDELVTTALDPASRRLTRSDYPVLSFARIVDIFGGMRSSFSAVKQKLSKGFRGLLLVGVLSMTVIGCSKEDDPFLPDEPDIVIPVASNINIEKAHQWIAGTISPTTGLVKTFPDLQGGYDYDVGWTFTQGQVIAAFLAIDDMAGAERVARGLLDLQGADGGWRNAYMAETGAVASGYEHATAWTGPNVVAARSLLQVYQRTSNASLKNRILQAVDGQAAWLQAFFVDRQTYGFFKGGEGVGWTSTEQNLRAMAFLDQYAGILDAIGRTQDGSKFRGMADKIALWVEQKMWAGDHYHVGYTSDENIDFDLNAAGDVQLLVPFMAGKRLTQFPHARPAVEHWLSTYEKTVKWNGKTLTGVARWLNTNSIWSEGMGDAIAAMQVLGIYKDKIKLYAETLRDMQDSNGGIPAALSDLQTSYPGHVPELSTEAASAFIAATGRIELMARIMPGGDGLVVVPGSADHSMNNRGRSDLGGIDLDAGKFDLQIRRDGRGVALPVDQQDIESIRIEGLVPMILDIRPVDLQLLK